MLYRGPGTSLQGDSGEPYTFPIDCTLECVIGGKKHVGVEHGATWMVNERPIGYGGKKMEVSCFTTCPEGEYYFGVLELERIPPRYSKQEITLFLVRFCLFLRMFGRNC